MTQPEDSYERLEDDEDDPTKAPVFKIAAWIVLVLAVLGIVLALVLS